MSHLFVLATNRKVIKFSVLPRSRQQKTALSVDLQPLTRVEKAPVDTHTTPTHTKWETLKSFFVASQQLSCFVSCLRPLLLPNKSHLPPPSLMLKQFEYRLIMTVVSVICDLTDFFRIVMCYDCVTGFFTFSFQSTFLHQQKYHFSRAKWNRLKNLKIGKVYFTFFSNYMHHLWPLYKQINGGISPVFEPH